MEERISYILNKMNLPNETPGEQCTNLKINL